MTRKTTVLLAAVVVTATAAWGAGAKPALLDPSSKAAQLTAPKEFKARFKTTKGDFVVKVTRAWAPNGADRFYSLVKLGFYDGGRFFRLVPGFVAQFGLSGDPKVNAAWRDAKIADDAVRQSNRRGTLTFATSGPDSRTTQLFVNFKDNARLDGMGFSAFGEVVEGMDKLDALNAEYGEGPDQGRIQTEGNAYLQAGFPNLDFVKSAKIVK